MPSELKACPFCGEKPKIFKYGNKVCVECHSDVCWIVPETACCETLEEAIQKWNRRANEDTEIADLYEAISDSYRNAERRANDEKAD